MNFYINISNKDALSILEFNTDLKDGFSMTSDNDGSVWLSIDNVRINWVRNTTYKMSIMIDNQEIYVASSVEEYINVWSKILKLDERKSLMEKLMNKQNKLENIKKDFEG